MTLAQLGLPETFTPARFRFPTRMFPGQKKGEYEPYRIRERRQQVNSSNGNGAHNNDPPKMDVEMKDAESAGQDGTGNNEPTEKTEKPVGDSADATDKTEAQPETFYEEDVTSDDGAVYPIVNGRIVHWPSFYALLTHVYNALSPPFHTPILMIGQPVWTARDREMITQFVFEKFKVPAFNIMDSALATMWGYGVPTALIVDIGKTKADVTAVTDFIPNEHGRGIAMKGCGGDAMTDRLVELLGSKGFTREMCEQLKRSNIAEILAPGTPLPGAAVTAHQGTNPAAAASTGGQSGNDLVPRGPGEGTQTGTDNNGGEDEGVLDVAAIVSGNTTEYLAKMEKEKTTKKGGVEPKQKNAPNHQKDKATFQFEEFVPLDDDNAPTSGSRRYIRHTREIEVGAERFLLATPLQKVKKRLTNGILEDLATQIHQTILAVPDATKRSELWDSLIIVGCGSRVRG
jgi:actin-related protein 9